MGRIATLLSLVLALLLHAGPSAACAPAPPAGIEVDIAAEDALIVWDAARKVEHFVRRADFRSASMAELRATGFGFLVPTPTRPELAEAPDQLFVQLADAIRPPVVEKRAYEISWALCTMVLAGAERSAAVEASAPIEVLEQKRVAGFDAAVLKADDADALATWLGEHGYAQRPALGSWLERYVADKWIITAFKIAADDDAGTATSAVRMSFASERPFFPYREPSDQRRDGRARSLRVWLYADTRMDGSVGGGAWPGRALHAAPLEDAARVLAGAAPTLPSAGWLHAFIDDSAPRPGSDELWFAAAASAVEVRLPPIDDVHTVHIPILLDVLAFVAFLAWGAVSLVRRRRAVR
jgi:hypothetical protein